MFKLVQEYKEGRDHVYAQDPRESFNNKEWNRAILT